MLAHEAPPHQEVTGPPLPITAAWEPPQSYTQISSLPKANLKADSSRHVTARASSPQSLFVTFNPLKQSNIHRVGYKNSDLKYQSSLEQDPAPLKEKKDARHILTSKENQLSAQLLEADDQIFEQLDNGKNFRS